MEVSLVRINRWREPGWKWDLYVKVADRPSEVPTRVIDAVVVQIEEDMKYHHPRPRLDRWSRWR